MRSTSSELHSEAGLVSQNSLANAQAGITINPAGIPRVTRIASRRESMQVRRQPLQCGLRQKGADKLRPLLVLKNEQCWHYPRNAYLPSMSVNLRPAGVVGTLPLITSFVSIFFPYSASLSSWSVRSVAPFREIP